MIFYALTFARPRGRCWKMHIANTDVTFCDGRRIKTIKLDENATLMNRCNQIRHPALDTKWERKTYNLDDIKQEQQEQKAKRRWPPGYPK